ncbi:MAG: hypothetical protein PF513_01230 [Tenericutes bacterium]|jgi:hypothetical protein|nr:hypothetical protein [Mycoplasmatota bacterium]
MKKVLTVLMLSFMFLLSLSLFTNIQAAEEIVDLYPYDQEACLLAEDSCTNTKVGSANWSMTYFGHRYYFIAGVMRYGHEMVDDNSDGWIDDNELSGLAYNAFATVFLNNTASQIDILTANSRTDITDVVHRKYAHFDENGVLQMFEDHISRYYIYNDGDATTPDWRLADAAEITAYQAEVTGGLTDGDPSADGLTRYTHIRMALDAVDTDGYVIEPLGYLKWSNADVDTTVELDVTKWSTIIADDPNNLYIPAGWTVVSFGTNDRGTANTKTRDFIESLPEAMIGDSIDPMFMEYVDQPADFNGVLALDDDATTSGINVVVDYNSTYTLPTDISASWVNMLDDTDDSVINGVEKLDYELEIYQDGNLLETITYTWNETTEVYDASGEQTMIDTSVFGSGYQGLYITETPIGDVTEVEVDIVIGVMPPKFIGVEDRYHDEDMFVDVLEGITADDGYGNSKTGDIEVTLPEGFNPYYPQPGTYEIGLEFTHHVFIEGISPSIDLNGTEYDFDGSFNVTFSHWGAEIGVYDDVSALQANAYSWGSAGVIIEVAGDGTVIRTINRRTWDLVDVNGLNTPANASGMFDTWLADLTLETDGYVIIVGASTGESYTTARALAFGDPVGYSLLSVDDVDENIVTEGTYILTVDDCTAPQALVVNDDYMIDSTDFANVNNAILANIVAFDNSDPVDDLAIYVSDNGGLLLNTPGTYTVEVTVEDMAGNTAIAEFDVEVVAAPIILTEAQVQALIDSVDLLTEAEVQAMLDDQIITQAEIQALIDANVMTEEDVQALIDEIDLLTDAEAQTMIDDSIDAIPESGCGSDSGRIPSLGIVGILSLLGAAIVLFRRRG